MKLRTIGAWRGLAFSVSTGVTVVGVACGSGNTPASSTAPGDGGSDVRIIVDPAPDPALSAIHADPPELVADGTTTTKISVFLKRSDGAPVTPTSVTLSSSGKGAKFTPGTGMTDEQGVFTATMTSTVAESKTVAATFPGGSLDVEIQFQLCHGPLFLPQAALPLGSSPTSLASGDFNADGKLDLAVLDDKNVSILLGKGDGTFSSGPKPSVGDIPMSVAVGDFNGDNHLDLAVATVSQGNVSVLLGNGDGSFGAATTYATGSAPWFVTVADFNDDKKLDLAVANASANTVTILLGDGKGTFAPAKTPNIPVGNGPYAIATGYVDADDKLDMVVANNSDKTLSILLGKGDGTFAAASNPTVAVLSPPQSVVTGDFNADNKLDIVLASTSQGGVSFLPGNGDGTFGSEALYAAEQANFVTTGNFHGQSKLDLVVTGWFNKRVSVVLDQGNADGGVFSFPYPYDVGAKPIAIAIGDFNGDGQDDLAVANQDGNSVSILLRSGCVVP